MRSRDNKKRIKMLTLVMAIMMIAMSVVPFQAGSLNAYAAAASEEPGEQIVSENAENGAAAESEDKAVAENGAEQQEVQDRSADNNASNDDAQVSSLATQGSEDSKAENGSDSKNAKDPTEKNDGQKNAPEKNNAKKEGANKLTFESKDLTATVNFDKKAKIPEGTKLTVKEITKEKDQFDDYYAKAVGSVQKDGSKDTKTKLSFVKFYDITLVKDGKEIEPAADVDVEIAYAKDASEKLAAKNGDDVRVIHFRKVNGSGQEKAELLAAKDSSAEISGGHLKKASFEADSFSVYAVGYTVDFHFENKDYSIAGETSIALSDLFEKLGIQIDVADVKDVKFSDPSLVDVKKTDNDWVLTSLEPFNTNEQLVMETLYGQLTINVTDAPAGDSYGDLITTDQIKNSVAKRKTTDIPVYFLLPDEKTISDYSFTIPSGQLESSNSTINAALKKYCAQSRNNYIRSNNYYYNVYDASSDTVDMKTKRGDVFNIGGSIYYSDYNSENTSLAGSSKDNEDNRIIIKNNINNNKYKLLDGDKIVIPLTYAATYTSGINYMGLKYKLDIDGKMTVTDYDSSYSGVPTIVDVVEYKGKKYPVKDITWFQSYYKLYLKGRQLKFSDEMLAKMSNHKNVDLPDIVKELPQDSANEVSEENGYIPGNNNGSNKEQIWKKAEYNEENNTIDYDIKYFKKMTDPENMDFILSLDESASMIDIMDEEFGIKAPRAFWMVAQAQVAARAVVQANDDEYNNRIAFVTWNDSASRSNYMNTKEAVDNWFSSTQCWAHIGGGSGIDSAVSAIKALVDKNNKTIIMNMSDFRVGSTSASNYLKQSTNGGKFKTFAVSVFGDTGIASKYQNSGTVRCSKPEDFIANFDYVIKTAIGYFIPSNTVISDELSPALRGNDIESLSASSGKDPTAEDGIVSWKLGGQTPNLTAGKLYSESFSVKLGDEALSGELDTNGACELKRSTNVINTVDSPKLKKDLKLVLKEENKNGAVIKGGSFKLYEGDLSDDQIQSNDPVWSGESDAKGEMTIPYGDGNGECRFAAGTSYTLVQTKTADGYALPAFSWKISVDANGIITATNKIQKDTAVPAGKVRSLGMASVSGKLEVYNDNYSVFEISNNSGCSFDLRALLSSSANMLDDPGVFLIKNDEWTVANDPENFIIENRTKVTLAVPASAGKAFDLDGTFQNPGNIKEIPTLIIDQNGNEEKMTITGKDHHYNTKGYITGHFAGKGGKVTVQFGEEIYEPVVPSGLPDISSGLKLPVILIIMIISCAALIMREFLLPAVRINR